MKVSNFSRDLAAALAALGGAVMGGDTTGGFPNPTVAGLQGIPVSATAPTNGQALVDNAGVWTPTSPTGDLAGTYLATLVAKVNGVAVTGTAANGKYIRATGAAAAVWNTIQAADYAFHDESLTDGASNFIFAGGDIVTVIGVPNP